MKLTNREKILLPSVLIVILAALFINFVYFPLSKEVEGLKLQSEDLELQLQEARGKQAEVDKLKQEAAAIQKDLEANNKDILKIWDQAELLVFLEKTLGSLCKKVSVDFYDAVPAGTLEVGDIDIVFNTDYDSLQKIWKRFEKADYFNTITSFSIGEAAGNSMEEDDDTEKELEVSMDIRFYSQKLTEEFPKKYDFMTGKFGKTDIFK